MKKKYFVIIHKRRYKLTWKPQTETTKYNYFFQVYLLCFLLFFLLTYSIFNWEEAKSLD